MCDLLNMLNILCWHVFLVFRVVISGLHSSVPNGSPLMIPAHLCFLTADGHIVPAKHLETAAMEPRNADEIRIQEPGKSTWFSIVLSPHFQDPCCPTISFRGAS